jgi:tRNA dimethylallyltransferase
MMNKVLAIVGPTAIGKSDLAVFLAKKLNGEVISADSRQVYRDLNVGSGKITLEEMDGIPHHLLDVANPDDKYTVADFKRDAKDAIDNILSRGKLPILCGGTGFWIDAVTRGLTFPEVAPNEELREELSRKSVSELYEQLKGIDPARAGNIDKHNPVRLIRAIEIATQIGAVPQAQTEKVDFDVCTIGITAPKEMIDARIQLRLERRMDGIVKEVRTLLDGGLTAGRLEALGLEYRHASLYIRGEYPSLEKMQEKLYFDIVHYAKRQMTWFKRHKDIQWVGIGENEQALAIAEKFINK